MFSQLTIEKIGYYVYCLVNPEDNSTFYIGKGIGNRVFSHAAGDLEADTNSDKLEMIKDIKDKGLEVEHYIIRYGLTEKEAFEIEAALIDFVGIENLTNSVKGHHTERGKISCKELDVLFGAEEVEIVDNILVIKINTLYRTGMSTEKLYEATRKSWVLSKERVETVDYVFSVYSGIVREVFRPTKWYKVKTDTGKDRLAFEGERAEKSIRDRYLYKSINKYLEKDNANPLKYIFGKSGDSNIVENEEIVDDLEMETKVSEKSLFIRINKEYRDGMSTEELYEATRKAWVLNKKRAETVDYVFSINQGTIVEIYKPTEWFEVKENDTDTSRMGFCGKVAEGSIRDKYIGKSVKHYFKQGEANPCKYINI